MRAIDADRLQKQFDEKSTNPNYRVNMHNIKSIISNAPTVEAIPKADYEARLKADMAAMLTDLSMEIGEIEDGYTEFNEENKRSLTMIPLESVERLIDEKINTLKRRIR